MKSWTLTKYMNPKNAHIAAKNRSDPLPAGLYDRASSAQMMSGSTFKTIGALQIIPCSPFFKTDILSLAYKTNVHSFFQRLQCAWHFGIRTFLRSVSDGTTGEKSCAAISNSTPSESLFL
jgi:hypothetical protein